MIGAALCMNKIDINNASKDDVLSLPLSNEKNNSIWLYINSVGQINTIYDLLNVNELTANDVHLLKDYIKIIKMERLGSSNVSYKTDQWLSTEGSSEGIAELWLDRYYNPQNVNLMNYDDLYSLPNLSPMDVVAVLKQQERGEISGTFQLKNSPGISHYGYKNLLDFVAFDSSNINKISIRYTSMVRSTPSTSSLDEDEIPISFSDNSNPETLTKLLLGYGNINMGFLRYNHRGEANNIYSDKAFLSFQKKSNNAFKLEKLIIGNFTASYGQGVIFESTDYYQPRRTGYKFSKRQTGINTDFTRSTQFVLSGIAAQLSGKKLRLSMFLSNGIPKSNNKRDAIINSDGSFSALMTMNPRIGYGYSNNSSSKINENLIDSVEEWTMGTNIRYSPNLSTNIGFTIYESLYDRVLNPQIIRTITGGDGDSGPDFDGADDFDNYSGDAFYLN